MVNEREMLERIAGIGNGYWQSQALFAALELGIFPTLRDGPKTADALAAQLGCDRRAMTILLRALGGLGLVRPAANDSFEAEPTAIEALTPGGRLDQTAILSHLAAMVGAWGQLASIARTGIPAPPPNRPDETQNTAFRAFIEGMHQLSGPSAEVFAALPAVSKARTMLDVGGGPATYAIAMARRHPELRATVLDHGQALSVARRHVCAANLEDRVTLRPGDALDDDYGVGYDLVLLSQLLHAFGSEENRAIVRRGASALAPGGLLVINEFALEEDGVSPPIAALFGVNMLVNTQRGATYKISELKQWLREAGLTNPHQTKLLERSTLIMARKAE